MPNPNITDRENLPPSLTPLDFDTVLVLRDDVTKRIIRCADRSSDFGFHFLQVEMYYHAAEDAVRVDITDVSTNLYEEDISSSRNHVTRIVLDFDTWKIVAEQVSLFHTEQRLKTLEHPERTIEDDMPF